MYYWLDGDTIVETSAPDDYFTSEYQVERLRRIREKTGLNRTQFSKKYHIPLRTLEEWESGRRKIAPYVLRMLSYYVSFTVAFPEADGSERQDHKEQRISKDIAPAVKKSDDAQWHPAFCAALKLDLIKYRDDLIFEEEFQLAHKPLEIDCLVIKKITDEIIDNPIARIFKKYNIFEYKSPGAALNMDTFYKTVAYGCLFVSRPGREADLSAQDITLTLLRDRKPRKLIKTLIAAGYNIQMMVPGIYYISGPVMFDIQLIISSELAADGHIALKAMTNKIDRELYEQFMDYQRHLKDTDYEFADMVMQPIIRTNYENIRKWKDDDNMCQALRELMAEEIEEEIEKAVRNAREEAIKEVTEEVTEEVTKEVTEKITRKNQKAHAFSIITLCNEMRLTKNEILVRLKTLMQVSEEQALEYYNMKMTGVKAL